MIAPAFAAAAQLLLAQRQPEQAKALLRELDELNRYAGRPRRTSQLPSLLRIVLALEDVRARPTVRHRHRSGHPTRRARARASRAQLAEAAGDHADAARLYAEAAERWQRVRERSRARLRPARPGPLPDRARRARGAEQPLREARELFASMGYKPALAETEALLGESEAAAS